MKKIILVLTAALLFIPQSVFAEEDPRSFVIRAARAVSDVTYTPEPELARWIKAAQKGSIFHPLRGLTEVDTDGDGVVLPGTDMTNEALAMNRVVTTFIYSKIAMGQMSPWNNAISLWVEGPNVANQMACNAAAVSHPGQITLCYNPNQYIDIQVIFVSAADNDSTPNIFYSRSVAGVSDIQRRDSIVESAKEGAEELETWIKAVQKGTYFHPMKGLTEVDTDGDGVVLPGTDLTNEALAMLGVVSYFVYSKNAMDEVSPWPYAFSLWVTGEYAANQAACNNVAAASPGQITTCYYPAQDNTIEAVFVSATDINGNLLYQKTVSAD